ncbi:hypothetical protein Y1Q_0008537 [Alligator mississippiensis]|uniref:Reverse transcriptase domain-containing protein n=1 Tax=Alligator mississippiensis TaxID=8496 RepID=A0A151M1N3_ALLMI|nr:hypothetical protein Y1Q_0008537 [Alligator mississippiensis]
MTVSHWSLFHTLEQMGGVLTCVEGPDPANEVSSEVQINGFLSAQIAMELGVWWNCPLSPILFICAIESLVHCRRQDPGICGVHILGSSKQEVEVLAYMDDLNILCWNKWLVEGALWHTRVYEVVAGAKLNVSNSTCFAVDELGDLESLGVSVTCKGVRILDRF